MLSGCFLIINGLQVFLQTVCFWPPRREFRLCEDTHALRLTSKLVDLQAGYANPIPRQSLGAGRFRAGIKKTSAQKDRGLFGTRNRNRTCN